MYKINKNEHRGYKPEIMQLLLQTQKEVTLLEVKRVFEHLGQRPNIDGLTIP